MLGMPLTPGVNEVQVFSTGRLAALGRERLLAATATRLNASVAQWVSEGRTECVEEEGRFSVRVPVGTYIVQRADGESVQVLVETGKVTTIP